MLLKKASKNMNLITILKKHQENHKFLILNKHLL